MDASPLLTTDARCDPLVSNESASQQLHPLWDHKTRPPDLRVSLLVRPRLLEKLNAGRARLVLLHAPAGYGKTTLLAQWREFLLSSGSDVAWLSFEQEDDDPAQLLTHLMLAASRAVPGIRSPILTDPLRGDASTLRRLLAGLASGLAHARPLVFILDDYHLAREPKVHDLVMQFIRAVPGNVRVVIASRLRGTLPTAALKARGHVDEIGPEHLVFTPQEAEELFRASIVPESLRLLMERTEGWPVAIQLARHWIEERQRPDELIRQFTGSSGDIALYLTEQIMLTLPPQAQQFLLRTAIVDQLNGDLADAICGATDSWQMLASLEPLSALLVPINGSSGWFRYHQLFLDYLRARQKSLGEPALRQLHLNAAQWFEAHGELEAAVKYATRSGDVTSAARMVERAGGIWICIRHGAPYLRRLLQAFPADVIDARPRLKVAQGLLTIKEGRVRDAYRELQEAHVQAGASGPDPDFAKDALALKAAIAEQGDDGLTIEDVAALEALLGDTLRTDRWLQGAVNELLCIAHIRRGNAIVAEAIGHEALRIYEEFGVLNGRIFARINLCLSLSAQGRFDAADGLLAHAGRLIRELMQAEVTPAPIVDILRAQLLYERYELEAAWTACDSGLAALERGECWFEIFDVGYTTAARILTLQGEFDRALAVLEQGQAVARRRGLGRLDNLLRYRRVEVLTRENKSSSLAADLQCLLDETRSATDSQSFLEYETVTLAAARLAIVQGHAGVALDLLRPLLVACQERGRMLAVTKGLALEGLAHRGLTQLDQAVASMVRALSLAAAHHWTLVFIEEGAAMAALLDEVLRQVNITALPAESVNLVAAILSANLQRTAQRHSDPQGLLKPREREVLEGIGAGLSNKLIGRRMRVTDEAVKYHLKKLYAKLGVGDRVMAVAVARKYGLLEFKNPD